MYCHQNKSFTSEGLFKCCWKERKKKYLKHFCDVLVHVLFYMLNLKYSILNAAAVHGAEPCRWMFGAEWKHWVALQSDHLFALTGFCIRRLWLCVSLDILLFPDCNGHFTNTNNYKWPTPSPPYPVYAHHCVSHKFIHNLQLFIFSVI